MKYKELYSFLAGIKIQLNNRALLVLQDYMNKDGNDDVDTLSVIKLRGVLGIDLPVGNSSVGHVAVRPSSTTVQSDVGLNPFPILSPTAPGVGSHSSSGPTTAPPTTPVATLSLDTGTDLPVGNGSEGHVAVPTSSTVVQSDVGLNLFPILSPLAPVVGSHCSSAATIAPPKTPLATLSLDTGTYMETLNLSPALLSNVKGNDVVNNFSPISSASGSVEKGNRNASPISFETKSLLEPIDILHVKASGKKRKLENRVNEDFPSVSSASNECVDSGKKKRALNVPDDFTCAYNHPTYDASVDELEKIVGETEKKEDPDVEFKNTVLCGLMPEFKKVSKRLDKVSSELTGLKNQIQSLSSKIINIEGQCVDKCTSCATTAIKKKSKKKGP